MEIDQDRVEWRWGGGWYSGYWTFGFMLC